MVGRLARSFVKTLSVESQPSRATLALAAHEFSGRLIVFDGMDGSGKTTLVREACEVARSIGAHARQVSLIDPNLWRCESFAAYMRDPAGAVGRDVDLLSIGLACTAFRLESMRSRVHPELALGTWVFCDRYVYTTLAEFLAFSSTESDYSALMTVLRLLPQPDLAFVASAPTDVCLERVRRRSEEHAHILDLDYFDRLNRSFQGVAENNSLHVVRTDGPLSQSMAEVRQQLADLVGRTQ